MTNLKHNQPPLVISSHRFRFMSLVLAGILLLFAFVLSACSGNVLPTYDTAAVAHASSSTASSLSAYPIKAFFSKSPESLNNFTSVYPVNRTSPTIAVATYSIQLLIAGPTLSERQAGFFTELNTLLSGPSTCSAPLPVGGPDFTLTLNMKGKVPQQGTATLQFCRSINSPGIGADARVQAEINATLKQFSNIKNVVILNKDGHCFADEIGNDGCLR
jgi:hypothetical protein